MRKLVLSTGNKNKVKEIKELLSNLNLEIVSKDDLGLADIDIVEDGKSLSENSLKKARALDTPYMVIADDSGLFVEALDGKPGVHSSRYAGRDGDDRANNSKLLEELKDFPGEEERRAYFKAVITLITENDRIIEVEGVCHGRIALEERGKNGFGYDPLFIPEGYDMTFAELDEALKNKLSHRSKALDKLKEVLLEEVE